MGVLARSLAIQGMLTSTKSLENHETDQKRCILSRKVYLMAIGQGFHGIPSPSLGSLPAGLKKKKKEKDRKRYPLPGTYHSVGPWNLEHKYIGSCPSC